jgi:perosamine synthetase
MTEFQAAIGLVQLKKLNGFNEERISHADYFNRHINVEGLKLPYKKKDVKHVYHQYAVTIEEEEGFPMSRDEFMNYLKNKGIGCAIHYPLPIHKQPLYQQLGYADENAQCLVATALSKKILSLPVHPELKYIAEVINSHDR